MSWSKLLTVPKWYISLKVGSSFEASFWATKTSFLSDAMAEFKASMDFDLPTNNVVTIPGKTTTSLNGIIG